jgi:hypothetical protein
MTYSNGLKSVVSGYGTERTIQKIVLFPIPELIDFTQSKLARWSS